jgi:hypothetical protein
MPLICPTCQNVFAGSVCIQARDTMLLCMGLFSKFFGMPSRSSRAQPAFARWASARQPSLGCRGLEAFVRSNGPRELQSVGNLLDPRGIHPQDSRAAHKTVTLLGPETGPTVSGCVIGPKNDQVLTLDQVGEKLLVGSSSSGITSFGFGLNLISSYMSRKENEILSFSSLILASRPSTSASCQSPSAPRQKD